ncbi:RNA 2',3'-cyclic phosphodiesterase [Knoellia subterranea]|uniref:RNA 2',3'-cyclic phosphodiesterase n=1 Tax=Knoellia subterranea KCTC 19937 TaxID=1385521 RepID=A0A0A0JR37_9MICO|nr:RNA 2',3'-cyclic phosphodiesterase [Knoellia subterranea]KGN39204.1 2'-5' RNA ligase [Knoellia subterranea KCTC 19937]
MRVFAAIVPPDVPHEHLSDFIEPRLEVESSLRWTPAHLWHITLAFMADVAEHGVDDVIDAVAGVANDQAPVPLRLSGAGVFPNPAEARVVWMDVQSDAPDGLERLTGLALHTRTAVGRVGASPAGGEYRPHLTLARARRPFEATAWLRVMDTYAGPSWLADEVTVFVSHRGEGRGRPHYEAVAVCPLGPSFEDVSLG